MATSSEKWQISLLSGVLFFIIASPFLFDLVNGLTTNLFGLTIAANGCPTYLGLFLHTVVFVLVVRFLMM